MKTFKDLQKESVPFFREVIKEAETKMKYTKQTVKRDALKKEILFWQYQIDDAENNVASKSFFERYPHWQPK